MGNLSYPSYKLAMEVGKVARAYPRDKLPEIEFLLNKNIHFRFPMRRRNGFIGPSKRGSVEPCLPWLLIGWGGGRALKRILSLTVEPACASLDLDNSADDPAEDPAMKCVPTYTSTRSRLTYIGRCLLIQWGWKHGWMLGYRCRL